MVYPGQQTESQRVNQARKRCENRNIASGLSGLGYHQVSADRNHEETGDPTEPTDSGNVDASNKPSHTMKALTQPEDEFESLAERFAALKKRIGRV
jgi:hypothetical protein